jgi:hypothetical protein
VDERRENVDRFRSDPDCWIFLVTVKAGGCGINLQVAHLVLVLDKDYTGTNEDQAIARVLRIGQRNTVRALFLLTDDPSESRVAHIADRKDKPRKAIIEGGSYNTSAAPAADDEQDEAYARRLIAESESYGTASSTIDCVMLLDPAAASSSTSTAASEQKPSMAADHHHHNRPPLCGIFDDLIITETDGGAAELAEMSFEHVQGAFLDTQCHDIIRKGWDALDQPDEREYGRGKREREDVDLGMPTDAFWDKYTEMGMDEEDIVILYRKMVADRERRKAAKLEEVVKAKGFVDTAFSEKVKLQWVSLRRRPTRKLMTASSTLPGPSRGQAGDDEHSSSSSDNDE